MPPIRYRSLFPPLLFPLLRHQTLALVLPALTLGASALALPATKVETLDDGGPRIVVRQDGLGDATTIQGGIDLLVAGLGSGIEVMPGEYDERVVIPNDVASGTIECPGGPDVTRVRAMALKDPTRKGDPYCSERWTVIGLDIREPVNSGAAHGCMMWRGCRFEGGYTSDPAPSGDVGLNLFDCEFDGPVRLYDSVSNGPGGFTGLRFKSAPLFVRSGASGALRFIDCTFEGPVDTAVVAWSHGEAFIAFQHCSFRGGRFGVTAARTVMCDEALHFDDCSFEDISEAAVACRYTDPRPRPDCYPLSLVITGSSFKRCEHAIEWLASDSGPCVLWSDTIVACRGTGAEMVVGATDIRDVRIELSGGPGMVLHRYPERGIVFLPVNVTASHFVENAGDGLIVGDTLESDMAWRGRIEGNSFGGNAGAGLRVGGHGESVRNNLVADNRGQGVVYELRGTVGLDLDEPAPVQDTVETNTIVLNGGDGLVVRDLGSRSEQSAWVSRNLVAGNGGVGLRTEGPAILPTEHNDAWMNVGGAYEGRPGGSEDLTLDPRFCDVGASDFEVQAGSPCGEAGPYGRIGALGVGCEVSRVAVVVEPQRINRRSREAVTAVMSGGRLLDVNRVDASTLRLAGVAPGVPGSGREVVEVRDADGDGYADLVAKFEARSLSLPVGERRVALEAATVDGGPLRGEAQVTVVGASQVPLAEAGESRGAPLPARLTLGSRASREGALVVRLGLPRAAPVRMEALDVAGRRVAVRMLPGNTVGWLAVRLGDRLSPGLYFVRATQGAETAAAKALVLR